ncbi:MAG: YeeE/YedE family protein [Deltaproteobacteria bacterium]|nr:YeeE/YedE family protein [Deltaproteobacteria bacterium]
MKMLAFIIVGVTCGILFARYQFCFAAAVRSLISFRKTDKIIIFLVLVIASAVLFNFFIGIGLLNETVKALMPMTFFGGILFGIGMVIAGGCVAGSLFRAGEGSIPSFIAAIGMIIGMAAFGFIVASHFTEQLPHFVGDTTLITLNIHPLVFSFIVAILSLMALGAILIENQETKRKFKFLLKISTVVAFNVAILNALFFFSYSNCQEMSPILLKEVVERGEDVIILDIRPQKFFDKDHIEGAISKDTLPNGLKDMNKYKDQMVVVVCGEGIISKLFCVKLNKGGFKKIYNLKGGMSTWH